MRAPAFAPVLFLAALAAPSAALAAEHIRGTVTAASADAITVKTREGATVRLMTPAKMRISGLKAASLAAVKKGDYVGTAAMPQADGSLRAQELLIFPARMRGVGEGHRPWDLTPGSTMTNANVSAVVGGVNGRLLTLKYKGGEKRVLVPADAPVVTIVKGSRAMLKPGAHIFAVAKKDANGGYTVMRIAVGVDGLKPPM